MNRRLDGPKVEKVLTLYPSRALVKPNHMLETPQKPASTTPWGCVTIWRTGGQSAGKAHLPWESSETRCLESGMGTRLTTEWILGFSDGEAHFALSSDQRPYFCVTRPRRDVQILYALKAFWKCGVVIPLSGERMSYRVTELPHLRERILPFFEGHGLKTHQRVRFAKFRRLVRLLTQDAQETPEGRATMHRLVTALRESPPF